MKTSAVGRWRIVEMEVWDAGAVDLLGPAYLEFDRNGRGSFQFVAVEGWMDVRPADHGDPHAIEFSGEGQDELDQASGRGWAVVGEDGALTGRIRAPAATWLTRRSVIRETVTSSSISRSRSMPSPPRALPAPPQPERIL